MSTAASPKVTPPAQGARITISNGQLVVPHNPIVPFIEGDGTGADIWRASVRVMDAAVAKAYGGNFGLALAVVLAGAGLSIAIITACGREAKEVVFGKSKTTPQ